MIELQKVLSEFTNLPKDIQDKLREIHVNNEELRKCESLFGYNNCE